MEKHKGIFAQQTTAQLLDQWDELSKKTVTADVGTVRGWYMEEFEKRDPEGFDKYIDGFYEDEELRNLIKH